MIASIKPKDSIPVATHPLQQVQPGELAILREGYRQYLGPDAAVDPHLAEVLTYVLSTEGSLMRAQLGYASMRACGASREQARRFGIAVEYFHTASLLFDDLPAMDAATYRRGKLCPHLKFSEADAILAALALITGAYDLLFSTLLAYPARQAESARSLMTECLGAKGILSGQSADVHYDGRTADGGAILAIAAGKTGSLLRLLLCFPALLHGLPTREVSRLEKLSGHWGHAYQVLDDLKDCLQSESETGKTVRRDLTLVRPNYMIKAGRENAFSFIADTLASTGDLVRDMVSTDPAWSVLRPLQRALDDQAADFVRSAGRPEAAA